MKKLFALLLVFVTLLCFVACDYEIIIKPKDTTETLDTGETENGESQTNQNNNQNNEQYSELLQNVITNDYYNNLIDRARGGDHDLYETANFRSNPYGFLEDEGYDVEAIRNGEIRCYTGSIVVKNEPNSLYMFTNVETKAATPYYTQYVIKYDLTEQEMKDYQMLHEELYIQACFINDMISQMKTPSVVSEEKITIEAYTNLFESLKKFDYVSEMLSGGTIGLVTLKSVDVEAGRFELIISTGASINSMYTGGQINSITLKNGSLIVAQNENGALYKPSKYSEYGFDKTNPSKSQTIILFQPFSNKLATHTSDLDE